MSEQPTSEPTTYTTAARGTVTLGFRRNAFGQPTHTYACNGCAGTRTYRKPEQADDAARLHAERCTGQTANGAAR